MLSHDALLRSAYGSAWTRAFRTGGGSCSPCPSTTSSPTSRGCWPRCSPAGRSSRRPVRSGRRRCEAIERHRADEALFVPTMTIAVLEAARGRSARLGLARRGDVSRGAGPVRLWRRCAMSSGSRGGHRLRDDRDERRHHLHPARRSAGARRRDGRRAQARRRGGRSRARRVPAGHLQDGRSADRRGSTRRQPRASSRCGGRSSPAATTTSPRRPPRSSTPRAGCVRVISAASRSRQQPRAHRPQQGALQVRRRARRARRRSRRCSAEHPAVAQAYVVGLADERMGEVGCAWVVPAASASPDPEELIALLPRAPGPLQGSRRTSSTCPRPSCRPPPPGRCRSSA